MPDALSVLRGYLVQGIPPGQAEIVEAVAARKMC